MQPKSMMVGLLLVTLLSEIWTVGLAWADDLDDGIKIDDDVASYEDLSTSSKNFSYLAQRARSKAASGSGDVVLSDGGALNSVIMDSGAVINGDIIIIDDSKGDKTVISN